MWTIHQPKPRTTSSQTFNFLNDPPARVIQNQLPTPSSSPDPRPSARRLSISDLVSNDERFGKVNTLQTAADTLERVAVSGDAVLMFDQTEEGGQLWDRLEGHARAHSPPPVRDPTVQRVALSYLTPPSSPEPVRKRDLAPAAYVEPFIGPEPITSPELTNPFSNVPADPASNESLECLSNYDYDSGDEWTIESQRTHTEELPECAPEPIYASNCANDGTMHLNPQLPISSTIPMEPPPFNEYNLSGMFESLGVQDLTSQLDASEFSEWPVARGGFGEVWKGALVCNNASEKKGRPIAVKRLTMYAAAGDEGMEKTRKRTRRELTIWSQLQHTNILPLLGACSFRGGTGLVSGWQENGNATEWVRTNPQVNRLELCEGICRGLTYLHDTGIVHGDLRGANVLICDDGTPKLIDFGLASITDGSSFSVSSTLAGTLRWMAPELQVTEGQGATKAGDMFAFGMTMLELFTGLRPFSAVKNDIAVLLKYQNGERPPRPSHTGRDVKGSKGNVIGTRSNIPRDGDEIRDVCVPMDDETWREVDRCWDQEPSLRPSASKMLEWFMWKRRRGVNDSGLRRGRRTRETRIPLISVA
ncbi:hypothetical protein OPQ81_008816 [Rhizoctonia solani]|nr:hypothetical protein OPQ81_008816 [Rhizoctonia solani]